MEIVLIIIAVFVAALFSVGIAYAVSLCKQRARQKEEFQRSQKQTKPSPQLIVVQKHRSVGFTAGNQQGSSSHDPMIAVAIASSSSSHSSGGYSGGSSCSGSDSSSSSSSDSSSCD